MKKPLLHISTTLIAFALSSTAFARSVERKAPAGPEPDLRKEAEEVQGLARRVQGELNFPGSDRLYQGEVSQIDSDVSRFNAAVRAHKYTKEQARSEVERIRAEFLSLEREVKLNWEARTRFSR